MADYRDHYDEIRAAGATVDAISVDDAKKSEALRRELRLPFSVLCDTGRRLVQDWDVYNPREKGGIAKPASFVIEPDRRVRYAGVDSVATRVPASEMVLVLQSLGEGREVRRKIYIPRPGECLRGIFNLIRR